MEEEAGKLWTHSSQFRASTATIRYAYAGNAVFLDADSCLERPNQTGTPAMCNTLAMLIPFVFSISLHTIA